VNIAACYDGYRGQIQPCARLDSLVVCAVVWLQVAKSRLAPGWNRAT